MNVGELTPIQEEFVVAVLNERGAQDKQWGGFAHDDRHVDGDWCDYLEYQVSRARWQLSVTFQSRMVKVAALAMAAYESSRRKNP